jgi:hypothetical protein
MSGQLENPDLVAVRKVGDGRAELTYRYADGRTRSLEVYEQSSGVWQFDPDLQLDDDVPTRPSLQAAKAFLDAVGNYDAWRREGE